MFDYDRLALDISLLGIRSSESSSVGSGSASPPLLTASSCSSSSSFSSSTAITTSPPSRPHAPIDDYQHLLASPHPVSIYSARRSSSCGSSGSSGGLGLPASLSQAISAESAIGGVFDCGTSSGYGSPGGTPLASPQTAASYLPTHMARAFRSSSDELASSNLGCCSLGIDILPAAGGAAAASSPSPSPYGNFEATRKDWDLSSPTPDASAASGTPAAPLALTDGFSRDEIADFEQLLCSPKKAPPAKYQCHICYRTGHYISDCPMRFNSPYDELTPYQGRKKCYGEFQCQQCKRKWTSQNSVANEAQSCIKCHIPVFPHKQLPVEKALALGYIKQARVVPGKLAPIGHGRPPQAAAAAGGGAVATTSPAPATVASRT